ncbi:MAG TPA: glycosyltransferase N-terminal domain-containing protein [Longimicrobiales bacterium]|nr:glycosyltransferase N-terminal domain-containing protein [Longimicrobiales bacterium]
MAVAERLYETAVGASRPLFRAAALVNDPADRAVRGRRASLARFEAWGAAERDPSRRLIWVHAPSVGEGLMAQAILGALREARPNVQLVFTHFSPSAERIAARVGADVAGYLPWDTGGPVRRALGALRPSAIAFVRTEIWPVLTREAVRVGTPLFLVNAVLAEDSSRLRWPARGFLAPVYRRLDGVGAVSEEHARRYERLGVRPAAIRVTGDARFDQVAGRISRRGLLDLRARLSEAGDAGVARDVFDALPGELPAIFRLLWDPSRFTVVAGSTWGPDEKTLVPVLGVIRRERRLRLVIAPHEPTPAHLDALEGRLERSGLRHARLGALVAGGGGAASAPARPAGGLDGGVPDAIIVDRLGILADLYALADLAYVGGGFHSGGLHSVVEPAGLGVPVLFGPNHGNAREAAALAQRGGGFLVRGAGDVEALIRSLAADRQALAAAGEAAGSYVASEAGAAARTAAMILEGR